MVGCECKQLKAQSVILTIQITDVFTCTFEAFEQRWNIIISFKKIKRYFEVTAGVLNPGGGLTLLFTHGL